MCENSHSGKKTFVENEKKKQFSSTLRLTENMSIVLSAFSFSSVHLLLLNDNDDRVENFC